MSDTNEPSAVKKKIHIKRFSKYWHMPGCENLLYIICPIIMKCCILPHPNCGLFVLKS